MTKVPVTGKGPQGPWADGTPNVSYCVYYAAPASVRWLSQSKVALATTQTQFDGSTPAALPSSCSVAARPQGSIAREATWACVYGLSMPDISFCTSLMTAREPPASHG